MTNEDKLLETELRKLRQRIGELEKERDDWRRRFEDLRAAAKLDNLANEVRFRKLKETEHES